MPQALQRMARPGGRKAAGETCFPAFLFSPGGAQNLTSMLGIFFPASASVQRFTHGLRFFAEPRENKKQKDSCEYHKEAEYLSRGKVPGAYE
jgi:hypothetical protein